MPFPRDTLQDDGIPPPFAAGRDASQRLGVTKGPGERRQGSARPRGTEGECDRVTMCSYPTGATESFAVVPEDEMYGPGAFRGGDGAASRRSNHEGTGAGNGRVHAVGGDGGGGGDGGPRG